MPRKKANYQRKGVKTKKLDAKANEVAEATPRQALRMIIEDFRAQVPRIIESACKKYERECNKALRQLPDKTCLPKEVYHMTLSDFIENGGTVEEAMKNLRDKKREEFDKEAAMKLDEGRSTDTKENEEPVVTEETDCFKTPAITTRSQLRSQTTAAKRKPNQLEEVKMIAMSKATGSPVDEKLVMESLIDDMVHGVMKNILPQITSKTAKAQASKAIELSLTAMKADIRQKSEVSLVTPSLGGATGRKRRVRK